MGDTSVIEQLGIDPKILDSKKEQTTKKVEYVRSYVEKWLWVWVTNPNTKSITFIDAMANAGIYKDGDLCTAAEVAKLFGRFAKEHPGITFRLYINEIDQARLEACVKICGSFIPDECANVAIVYANMDVNAFLHEAATTNKVPYGPGNAVLLFVDPYDMGTVHYGPLREFISTRYCELLFNYFSSDLNRNGDEERVQRIVKCFDGLDIPTNADAGDAIADALRVGSMKYVFSYPFRIMSNRELYQIIFVSPHPAGLAKLKDALWDVFHGAAYHRNSRPAQAVQASLFDTGLLDSVTAASYATDAQEMLLETFSGKSEVSYGAIATYLLERTMMRDGQFIDNVLRPLVKDGRIRKDGKVGKTNFKRDTFTFPGIDSSTL